MTPQDTDLFGFSGCSCQCHEHAFEAEQKKLELFDRLLPALEELLHHHRYCKVGEQVGSADEEPCHCRTDCECLDPGFTELLENIIKAARLLR